MNEIEEEFLIRHKIDFDSCVDLNGSHMTKAIKYWMEFNEKKFAYNTYPCNRDVQHTIKNSKGQCIMCKTASIHFQIREHEPGYVYIAGTKWGMKIKIGSTTNYEKREKYLNEYKGYGFHADWKILAVVKVDEMGFRERQFQNELEKYRDYTTQYYHGKDLRKSNEVFRCSYKITLDIFEKLCNENGFHLKLLEKNIKKYNFRNLIKPE